MANEKRLIEPDEFLKWVVKRFKCVPLVGSCDNDSESMKSLIAQAPTVDAVEVVHGRWDGNGNCSACGKNIYKDMDADIWSCYEPPYCPNCGAKMDGGILRKFSKTL